MSTDQWEADDRAVQDRLEGETLARVGAVLAEAAPETALICHAGPIRAARMIVTGASYDTALAEAVPYATAIRFAPAAKMGESA